MRRDKHVLNDGGKKRNDPLIKRVKRETSREIQKQRHSSNVLDQSQISHEGEDDVAHDDTCALASEVNEAELVKVVSQCILESVSKRGFVRDVDIAEVFMDRHERVLKETVLKKANKLLLDIFGFRFDRDEEAKCYYLSTHLFKGVELAQRMIDEDGGNNDGESDPDDIINNSVGSENAYFKDCLLQCALMFIFMTKKQTGTSVEAEKGVDQVLLKSFLADLLQSFNFGTLSSKQYGDLFGPGKSAEFVSQGWLRYDIRRDQTTGNEEVSYKWGPRAETVVSKKKLLEAFCEVYGSSINNWPNHARVAGFRGRAA